MNDEKGSSLIEVCVLCAFFLLSSFQLILIIYLYFSKIWVHFWNHEFLICLSKKRQEFICETLLRKKGVGKIPHLKIRKVKVSRREHKIVSQVEWRVYKKWFKDTQVLFLKE